MIMVMQELCYKSESCFMLCESHLDPLILLFCTIIIVIEIIIHYNCIVCM